MQERPNAFATSKQNSDANGMLYQWGRKDPFTFPTNSEKWGNVSGDPYGKYAVKIYTIDGVLIYQEDRGSSNKDKTPVGGTITTSAGATSMMETIKNPIMFYGSSGVISQSGHTKDLWNYYWTSYSRGTDGKSTYPNNNKSWHNDYLNDYVSQRLKSIYDPCPYGFKISSNGIYNQLYTSTPSWVWFSYLGGYSWSVETKISWFPALGSRQSESGSFYATGYKTNQTISTVGSKTHVIVTVIYSEGFTLVQNMYERFYGSSVRCIERLILQLSSVRPD